MKEYTHNSGHGPDLLATFALMAIIAGLTLPLIDKFIFYPRKYNKAQEVAVQVLGDKKAPLTVEEKAEWYSLMDVKSGEPSNSQLEKFTETYNK